METGENQHIFQKLNQQDLPKGEESCKLWEKEKSGGESPVNR